MPSPVVQEAGTVTLDSKRYRLVRIEGRQQSYVQGSETEPPWVEGAPALVSDPAFTWHLGALKSRPGVTGSSEYGKNTDGRFQFRLLPGAQINTLTLPSSAATPSSIFEAMGWVFVCAGTRVYRINPTTDAVVLSKDFTPNTAVMGLRWETDSAFVCTSAATQSLWQLTSGNIVGGGPDTWTQTADVVAYRLAAGINRLFKITQAGELRNLSTSLNPLVNANWADAVQVGATDTIPTSMLAYERTVFVGKPEGLFGVGDDGFGLPLIKRMVREATNCYGMASFDPWTLVPHIRGLYRFVPGIVESIGLEKETLNESPIRGQWKGFAFDGEWIYGLLAVGTETYVMTGRERKGNEPAFGPIIWDTWLHFAAASEATWMSSLSASPRFWFGNGVNVSYVTLSTGGGAPDVGGSAYRFALSGSRFTYRFRFDDWHPKDYPKFDIVGRNLSANVFWDIFYSIDGGAYSNLDAAGAGMRLGSNGLKTFFLPTTAVGREVQFRFDYTSNSTTAAGEISYFEAFCAPQSRKIPVIACHLELAEGLRHEGGEIEERTALAQFADLQALLEQATAVSTYGPWGEAKNAFVRRARIVETAQEGTFAPSFIVELGLQLRESI